jgi:hypothetical protein
MQEQLPRTQSTRCANQTVKEFRNHILRVIENLFMRAFFFVS